MARISLAIIQNYHLKYAWSLSAYRQLFHDPLVGELLKRSFLLALTVTVICFLSASRRRGSFPGNPRHAGT